MKFLLKSPFDTLTGFGNDGVGMAHALMGLGHDVHVYATTIAAPIPEDIARLFTKWPAPPFDVVIAHLSPTDDQGDSEPLRKATERLLFWTMWEYENFRIKGWEDAKVRFSNSHYDLMLAYDEVTKGAMSDPEVNPGIPIHILQGGYEPEFWAQADPTKRDWSGTFRFGMAGRLHNRKNPWAAIRAFRSLKLEHGDRFDAELHLKTTLDNIPKQVEEWTPGIHVHYEWWPHERMREFYESLHCYLAPSVGEGKNLPALESQTAGVPVIGTLFGGHTGWMSPEFAYPLRFEVKEMNSAGLGASADEEHLRELMWHVYVHRAEAKQKGAIAARTIPASMSWRSVMMRLIDLLHHWPFEGSEHEREGRSPLLV